MEKQPIAGFWGNFDESVNVNLVEFVANRCREWAFVFFGDVNRDISRLNKYKNIYFISQEEYCAHPEAQSALDVWLLPLKPKKPEPSDNLIRNVEFQLATTKPIIMYPEVKLRENGFKNLLIANDYDEFKDHLNEVYDRKQLALED
ncbi:hypothetical protein JXJ21_15835 [candidate division KSB1 bacterium]|nr:hypothetical protein [candidate division KSB1 bacterium]